MGFFDFLKTNNSRNLNFTYKSRDHLRYEGGQHTSGPHGGAGRVIKVEPNISGGEGFTVTMYNLDGPHPMWQNNVQMAPKQMKIIRETKDSIVLRGYGYDSTGATFADYGLTIHYQQNGEPLICTLHMHDRDINIEYLPFTDSDTNTPTTPTNKGQIRVDKIIIVIASSIINTLIENCDDDGAYASQSRLNSEIQLTHNFTPTHKQFDEAILLINSVFPAHNDIVNEQLTGNMLNPIIYVSQYALSSLKHVQNGINKALDRF